MDTLEIGELHDSGSERRRAIIDFITKNPESTKQDVVIFCTKAGIGSRVTLMDSIEELIEEGILNDGKERKNSKSYRLTVNAKNLLLSIPQDLDIIFEKYKKFIEKLSDAAKIIPAKDDELTFLTPFESKQDIIAMMSYQLILVINDVYNFFFLVILPKKISNQDYINRLYSAYFRAISNMYNYISKNTESGQSSDLKDIRTSAMYKNYMEFDSYSSFDRLWKLVWISRKYNLEQSVYEVLDPIWVTNKESVVLLYQSDLVANLGVAYAYQNEEITKTDHGDEIIGKLHDRINLNIQHFKIIKEVMSDSDKN